MKNIIYQKAILSSVLFCTFITMSCNRAIIGIQKKNGMMKESSLRKRHNSNNYKGPIHAEPLPVKTTLPQQGIFFDCFSFFSLTFFSSKSKYEGYPLHQLVEKGDLKALRSYLNRCKDNNNSYLNKIIDQQCKQDGNNALHVAVINKKIEIIKELISEGIDVNLQNNDGNTAYHLACQGFNSDVMSVLEDSQKIDPSIKNNKGQQALGILRCKLKERGLWD